MSESTSSPKPKESQEDKDPKDHTSNSEEILIKKCNHPIGARLKGSSTFKITSPGSLIGAGFASFTMGMLTVFRPTPPLLYSIAINLKDQAHFFEVYEEIIIIVILAWSGSLLVIFFVLGFFLALSETIKKRKILLMHPWGLMLLYFDVIVWLLLTISLHSQVSRLPQLTIDTHFVHLIFFIFMYVEETLYFLGYYTYATYFIAGELTVIERFY